MYDGLLPQTDITSVELFAFSFIPSSLSLSTLKTKYVPAFILTKHWLSSQNVVKKNPWISMEREGSLQREKNLHEELAYANTNYSDPLQNCT